MSIISHFGPINIANLPKNTARTKQDSDSSKLMAKQHVVTLNRVTPGGQIT